MYLVMGRLGRVRGGEGEGEGREREGGGKGNTCRRGREGGIKQCDILCIQKAKAESQIAEMKQKCQGEQEEVSLGACADPPSLNVRDSGICQSTHLHVSEYRIRNVRCVCHVTRLRGCVCVM